MRVELLAGSKAPGMFSISAENATEIMLLDIFTRWAHITGRPQRLFLSGFGGNRAEGVYSMQFHWRDEADFACSARSERDEEDGLDETSEEMVTA